MFCILFFCTVLCIVSPHVYSCFSFSHVQVYGPLSLGGSLVAVNKYHHISSCDTMNWSCISAFHKEYSFILQYVCS